MRLETLKAEDQFFLKNKLDKIYSFIDSVKAKSYLNFDRIQEKDNRFQGWGAELAICRWAQIEYLGEKEGSFNDVDVGHYGQIKWTKSSENLNLLVEIPKNKGRPIETMVFVLTTGIFPSYEIVGWIGGSDFMLKKQGFKTKHGSKEKWRVLQSELRTDFELLKLILGSDSI